MARAILELEAERSAMAWRRSASASRAKLAEAARAALERGVPERRVREAVDQARPLELD